MIAPLESRSQCTFAWLRTIYISDLKMAYLRNTTLSNNIFLYITVCLVSPEGTVSVTEDILTTHNSSVNMTCTAGGGPDNAYKWRKQGDLISSDPRLYFQSITGSDGGVYQCTVINEAGGDTSSVFLSGMYATYVLLHAYTDTNLPIS